MAGEQQQADFAYHTGAMVGEAANDPSGIPLLASVFADSASMREELAADALAAGLRLGQVAPLDALLGEIALPLGDLVLLDCPLVSGAVLASLSRLDGRAANIGARLIISTSVAALDDVFGCMDRSAPQILVDPGRGERAIALGQALGELPQARLRELSADERITLVRLTEQVAQIAQRLERMGAKGKGAGGGAFRFESPAPAFRGAEAGLATLRKQAGSVPELPDPVLLRRVVRQRQARARFFDAALFADPAWDMLLDLTIARAEGAHVSVSSLCIASGVPPTTALRWIGQMVEARLLERHADAHDRRRAIIRLSEDAAAAMARYFAEIGVPAGTG